MTEKQGRDATKMKQFFLRSGNFLGLLDTHLYSKQARLPRCLLIRQLLTAGPCSTNWEGSTGPDLHFSWWLIQFFSLLRLRWVRACEQDNMQVCSYTKGHICTWEWIYAILILLGGCACLPSKRKREGSLKELWFLHCFTFLKWTTLFLLFSS